MFDLATYPFCFTMLIEKKLQPKLKFQMCSIKKFHVPVSYLFLLLLSLNITTGLLHSNRGNSFSQEGHKLLSQLLMMIREASVKRL